MTGSGKVWFRRSKRGLGAAGLIFFLSSAGFADPQLPGGEGSTRSGTIDAFSLPSRKISKLNKRKFMVGRSFFRQNWISFPSSVRSLEGLGPTFVAQSCTSCHDRDGRGRPPLDGKEEFRDVLFRLSLPGKGAFGEPLAHPVYGDQIQNQALPGVPAEARPRVEWKEIKGRFADGETYTLTRPIYSFESPAHGELPAEILVSPRVAPVVFGLGLLESISEKDILANEDPEDRDGDGISGRVNRVWDHAASKTAVGRFGWKANQPHLRQQNAAAFHGDMGITTSLFRDQNCPPAQEACRNAPKKDAPEISDEDLESVHLYTQLLSVPARRKVSDEVEIRGAQLMRDLSCVKCHTPSYRTSAASPFKELRNQKIYPYTDLLLHDMGEDLADGRPDFLAEGREWRTPPLWGIGMVKKINKHSRFLHDGRARSLEEAILWHDGEARASRQKYQALSKTDRSTLIEYIESL